MSYEVCPKCGKKGYYTPKPFVGISFTRYTGQTRYYGKVCKYCGATSDDWKVAIYDAADNLRYWCTPYASHYADNGFVAQWGRRSPPVGYKEPEAPPVMLPTTLRK